MAIQSENSIQTNENKKEKSMFTNLTQTVSNIKFELLRKEQDGNWSDVGFRITNLNKEEDNVITITGASVWAKLKELGVAIWKWICAAASSVSDALKAAWKWVMSFFGKGEVPEQEKCLAQLGIKLT